MTPLEWETFSDVNINKAEKERNNSVSLRALVENLLVQTAADVRKQYEATGSALTLRILETRSIKAELEDQLSKVHIGLQALHEFSFVSLGVIIVNQFVLLIIIFVIVL